MNGNVEEMDEDSLDMYTRVKRARRRVKRDMYGMPIAEEMEEDHTEEDGTTENEEEVGIKIYLVLRSYSFP